MIELYFFVVILSSAITIVVLAFLVVDRASRERAWRDVAMERRRNHDERDGRQCGEISGAGRRTG